MPAPAPKLSKDQIVFYHINGYLTLENLVSAAELPRLISIYDDLFAQRAGWSSGDHFDLGGVDEENREPRLPQILDVSRYAPELKTFDFYRATAELGRQLLGEQCVIRGEHAINKPGNSGDPTPWHQDEAYWDPKMLYESLSIWIPLQPVDEDNGCMQFLPRSNKLGVLQHRSIGGDTRVHGLEVCEPDLDLRESVSCPLGAGGATIHGNRTLHYSGPNNSGSFRRALIVMLQLPPQAHPMNRSFHWNEVKQTSRKRRASAIQY